MPQVKVNCPDAIHKKRTGKSDTKAKFYINTDTNKGYCFRCKFKTRNAKEICEKYGVESVEFASSFLLEPEHGPKTSSLLLPSTYSNIFSGKLGHYALNYLLRRGVSTHTIATYELGYTTLDDPRYPGRIIIPIYENGVLVNFQGRDFTGESWLRYDGPSRADGAQPNCLFNIDRAERSGIIFLVEGPLDAMRMPEYAVSLIGSVWNNTKRKKLLRAKPKTVILCLDSDQAGQDAKETIYKDLYGLVPTVLEFRLSCKDLGEVPNEELETAYNLCKQEEILHKSASRGN
jgi:DNA primase